MLSVIADFASNTKAVPRHWDPEKLIVNKRTIQHFRSKAGSQCQAL
ncbi:hypothetical protein [Wolbachia endosymbiont (group A) of Conops quadrifasciatus]